MTHERLGRILAGTTVLLSVGLGYFVSPWFLLAAAGASVNFAISGITDRCPVKSLLIRMGFPGERDVGRAEVIKETAARTSAARINRLTLSESRKSAAVN